MHGEDVHAVGRRNGAQLGRHVLATHRHAGHARFGGDRVEMRERRRAFDQHEKARVAHLHAEGFLTRRHQLGQQPDVLGAHDLGQHQCRDARHHRRCDVGNGQFERTIDAHHDIGAVLGNPGHGGRQRLARGILVRGNDRIFEIEDERVGATRVRLGEEAFRKDRDEQ